MSEPVDQETTTEQHAVDVIYAQLDADRATAQEALGQVRGMGVTGTHQSRTERDAFARLYEDRLSQLLAVEERLVFGRMDFVGGDIQYVGRTGLSNEAQEQVLMDWRAPAATPFYQATAARPDGLARRRHVVLHGRSVTSLEDDVLDLAATKALGLTQLRGEGALVAAVSAQRTGRMGDIVATIQAEQDVIIRDDPAGVLVVQGGPGTGKTAVALHRAAFLLYSQRERLTKSGVLVVGPSPVFLRYIEQVLPALGETGVVMMSVGELLPGVTATGHDEGVTSAVKGSVRMAGVLAAAVQRYQQVPRSTISIAYEDTTLTLRPRDVEHARSEAQRTGKPHNEARSTFVKILLGSLADGYARATNTELDRQERAVLMSELRSEPDIRRAINTLWLPLTPQLVLRGLFALPRRLDAVCQNAVRTGLIDETQRLTEREKQSLWRDPDQPFTVDDVPLLDELAELIGEAEGAERASDSAAEHDYADQVLANMGVSGMVSASMLAERFAERGPSLTLAERAAADRTWAYGHLVVDEAQELSAMAWRALLRRVPSKSVTAVGDLAQTRSGAGAKTWQSMLEPFVGDRLRVRHLTVNYRTPGQIMRVANHVAEQLQLAVTPNESVREGNWPVAYTHDDWWQVAVDVVAGEREYLGTGRVAVLCPPAMVDQTANVLTEALGQSVIGVGAAAVDFPVAVMTPADSKGLEFDGVVLVDPMTIMAHPQAGPGDLFVALTRPTQRMHVVHRGELPPGMG